MSQLRHRRRVDSNHKPIVDAFRQFGWEVLSLAPLGSGVPDLLVSRPGEMRLVEVKTPKGKLKPMQETFMASWPVSVVRSIDDVQALSIGSRTEAQG